MNWAVATNETATKITKLLLFQSLNFQEQLTSILTSIASEEALNCWTNSPCKYPSKCIENSMENMHTDVKD